MSIGYIKFTSATPVCLQNSLWCSIFLLISQVKSPTIGRAFYLVTSVVQTWNTLLEDLEKIDVAIEEYLNEEER